jgi:uncharacterized protein (DUF1684 family)
MGRMQGVDDVFLGDWQRWHSAREERLVSPYGFLSITGLHWLDGSPQQVAGVPGTWSVGPDGVVVELHDGESLTLDGRALTGRAVIGPVDDAGLLVDAGEVRVEVARRGDAVLLRPRDPAHPLRAEHQETPTFPPSPEWRVEAKFFPYGEVAPTAIEIQNSATGAVEDAVGEVEFEIDGQPQRLVALDDGGGLWLLFADATSGYTTYGAGRQLYAPAPSADGIVVLDFNRATNLPCAYTLFTTCPVPPPQNRLAIAIPAGEKVPGQSR